MSARQKPRSAGTARTFALAAVIVGGLAALKALDVVDEASRFVGLEQPAFASEGHDADAGGAHDPIGEPEAVSAMPPGHGDEEGVEAQAEEASAQVCEAAPSTLADRSGLSLSELQVLRSLAQRRRDLDARESDLMEREGLLQAAEARVEGRVEELRALETQVETLLGQLDDAEEAQINSLVALYGRMKSDEAARIFAVLDRDVLIDVASRMSDQTLAPIMADMDETDAAALTLELARRHQAPETLDAIDGAGDG